MAHIFHVVQWFPTEIIEWPIIIQQHYHPNHFYNCFENLLSANKHSNMKQYVRYKTNHVLSLNNFSVWNNWFMTQCMDWYCGNIQNNLPLLSCN